MPPQTQNRKDLLQAYRLMTQRTALALIAGEPDSANQPLRRRNTATVMGVLVGVIACVLFGVLGVLSHGGALKHLNDKGNLVIDKDTATAYIACDGGDLCPTLNYTSARLALDSASPPTQEVSQNSLAGYKIGPTLGIAGLPPDLPTPADLVKSQWSVCIDASRVTTLVGGTSVHGTPLTKTDVELVTAQGQDWVLYNGSRFSIQNSVMRAIWPSSIPATVTPAWLNTLPESPTAFVAPAIQGWGTPLGGPDGQTVKVGQVYSVASVGRTQYYVFELDRALHSVTAMQANLLEHQQGSPQPKAISPGQEGALGTAVPNPGLPSVSTPTIPPFTAPACVTYGSGTSRTVTTGATVPLNYTGTGNGSSETVDRVWLPAGDGALIGISSDANSTSAQVSSWCLLVGATRYGLNGSGVASVLGYNLKSDQTVLPQSLVSVLPQGQALDPASAKQQAAG